ncbi:major facilitator super transporter protein, variant 2 [Coniochaeta pulveracea]|uniref:GPI ethanolamine phosphate transferase 2 n=1 Tax=Coniochaeta pulveracea TaxID=177199 RepID=A0A420Y1G0_9PEZI|nr:major facilitator super transporter protein, variant 2 [Coniochaeta pulveracea]
MHCEEESGFQYTQSLIRDGAAFPFTAHATSPTVTMPRLKAITTGSIPSFLDVILNLDETDESSSLASQDTWLAQMKAKGAGKLVMYGDDTWLKLFPNTFDRADGTTSFFVSDFTEVDNNVTRNIAGELKNTDWDAMVLHYLGLDHIGHKGGPRSPHMLPKQSEMDGIVQQIYTAIESEEHLQSTLFVMCGDHGMNDAGNHGASSPGETSPALVFMSPKLKTIKSQNPSPLAYKNDFQYYSTVEQSDIAPTLAALLGFPVPKNNLGAFIDAFLPFWERDTDKAQILMQNARQTLEIIKAAFGPDLFTLESPGTARCDDPQSGSIEDLACQWQELATRAGLTAHSTGLKPSIVATSEWLREAQTLMSSMASNYNMPRLILGQALAVTSLLAAVIAASLTLHGSPSTFIFFAFMTITYGLMMFASSYVEEEQHFWYWTSTAWLALVGLRNFNTKADVSRRTLFLSTLLVLTVLRLVRGWNQTGQKFAGGPDIVKTFLNSNPNLLWALVGLTYAWLHRDLIHGFSSLSSPVAFILSTGLVLTAFTFKLAFTAEDAPELLNPAISSILTHLPGSTLIARAQAVFIGLGVSTLLVLVTSFFPSLTSSLSPTTNLFPPPSPLKPLQTLYTVLATIQSRTPNIPLFLLLHLLSSTLTSLLPTLSIPDLSLTTLLLAHTSFFAMGGTNAISSIDLSSAYNGISTFSPVPVGILTFVGNWAGAIWWTFEGVRLLVEKWTELKGRRTKDAGEDKVGVWLQHVATMTVFVAGSVVAVMGACTALRTHLFVWTVFSPKYLYAVGWAVGMHLVVNLGLGGVLFWFGCRV